MHYQVILSGSGGRISGVNTFSVDLVRGLREAGVPARILCTDVDESGLDALAFPADIPVDALQVGPRLRWTERWQAMIQYLESQAPCIYIPNYDFAHACVAPKLSDRVGVVGVVHSDDWTHYEHVARMGAYWNAVVAVSPAIAAHVVASYPWVSGRVVTLSYGVPVPDEVPDRSATASCPLRVLSVGRLEQRQKRVLDLPGIVSAALRRGVPVELAVIGGGLDERRLMRRCAPLVKAGAVRFLGSLPRDDVLRCYEEADVFVLPSAYEGLPVSLLEAMGRGCVPVVSAIRSGVPELVRHGVNGLCAPVGEVEAFASALELLYREPHLRRSMAQVAHATIGPGGYTVTAMIERYVDLFERVWQERERGAYLRPSADITPPPSMRPLVKYYLPPRIRRLVRSFSQTLQERLAPAG